MSCGASPTWERQLLAPGDKVVFVPLLKTSGRRSSPRPQIVKLSGPAGIILSRAECTYVNPRRWSCKADLDNAYRLGKADVECEGWDSPSDPYILAGSCQLQYRIQRRVPLGQQIATAIVLLVAIAYAPYWLVALTIILAGCARSGSRRYRSGRRRIRFGAGSKRR